MPLPQGRALRHRARDTYVPDAPTGNNTPHANPSSAAEAWVLLPEAGCLQMMNQAHLGQREVRLNLRLPFKCQLCLMHSKWGPLSEVHFQEHIGWIFEAQGVNTTSSEATEARLFLDTRAPKSPRPPSVCPQQPLLFQRVQREQPKASTQSEAQRPGVDLWFCLGAPECARVPLFLLLGLGLYGCPVPTSTAGSQRFSVGAGGPEVV